MLHERNTALCQRLWVFFRPDNVFGLLQNWSSILNSEFEFWIKVTELDTETSCLRWHEMSVPAELCVRGKHMSRAR